VNKNESYERELRERGVRQAQLDAIVKSAMARVIAGIDGRQPAVHTHFFYGASAIHPKHLVAWYLFRTDSEKQTATDNGLLSDLERATRAELSAGGYPVEGIELMRVCFTSDEDIQRETGGDYWAYFK
jgi:hypothetical protein